MTADKFREQKARDALAFDPLPPSSWIRVGNRSIEIRTNYSEALSRFLRALPGAKWSAPERCWKLPFLSSDALRASMPELERLAVEARQRADMETERRKQEQAEWAAQRRLEQEERDRKAAERRPRPLQQEYLTPIAGRPLHMIWLEAIGDDLDQKAKMFGWIPRHAVAQVMGSNGKGGWTRAYLRGIRDYSKANSVGSRGVMVGYQIEEGPIYWVASPQTWGHTDRYFLRVVDGAECRMTEEEVRECLVR